MPQLYLIEILVLSTITIFGLIGKRVTYGSNQRNNACYDAGFTDGRTLPYNQTKYNQCGTDGRAYYEGLLSGCISGQGKDFFSCQKMTNAPPAVILVAVATVMLAAVAVVGVGTNNWENNSRLYSSIHYRPLTALNNQEN